MKSHSLIQTCNLSHSYVLDSGTVQVLEKIDFKVSFGELVAIMGASGSGKSTLLHVLGCLSKPVSGTYIFNGQDVSTLSEENLAKIRAGQIGFVFQSHHLIPHLNVYENLEVPFLYQSQRISKNEIRERIHNAAKCARLEHRLQHRPSQLSGGESQRAAIARALVIHPHVILADEPTGNLDSKIGEAIMDLFIELNQLGTTFVIVTHDEKVGANCQKIFKIKDGQLGRVIN